jgi:hypothetical protein
MLPADDRALSAHFTCPGHNAMFLCFVPATRTTFNAEIAEQESRYSAVSASSALIVVIGSSNWSPAVE